MTADEFFNGSPYLACSYRESDERIQSRKNHEMWLQGLYISDAFRAGIDRFAYGLGGGKGKQPQGYIDKPIPLTDYEKQVELDKKIQHTMEWVRKGQQ